MPTLIKKRGYKDFNTIGEMRALAHSLEDNNEINLQLLLMIRRYEKDFLLRNEDVYLGKITTAIEDLKNDLKGKTLMPSTKKIKLNETIDLYYTLFNKVVLLDKEIGLANNEGLKKKLDEAQDNLTSDFQSLLVKANQGKEEGFMMLKNVTIILVFLLLAIGTVMGIIISTRITNPIAQLNDYINHFVENNFRAVNEDFTTDNIDETAMLTKNFKAMQLEITEHFAKLDQVVADRTKELGIANAELKKINNANSRFVPIEFLQYLNKKNIFEIQLGDHVSREMTFMFSDIRGYIKFSEKLSPEENFRFINKFLKEIVPAVKQYGGFIDKYIGDSVMSLFPTGVEKAIDSAIYGQLKIRKFSEERLKKGEQPIQIGIGIHTGRTILGTIGVEKRIDTTVISDAVNTASRLEGLSSTYGCSIIISKDVYEEIKLIKKYNIRFLDEIIVKGKENSIEIYEVLNGLSKEEMRLRLETLPHFQKAIKYYRSGDFRLAIKELEFALKVDSNDKTLLIYHKRSLNYLKKGFSGNWDHKLRIGKK